MAIIVPPNASVPIIDKQLKMEQPFRAWTREITNALEGGAINASAVGYDPAASGLTATDVQAAVDELAAGALGGREVSAQVAITVDYGIGANVVTDARLTGGAGGGAEYVVVAGATGTDDGGSFLDMVNGNQLKLTPAFPVEAEVFGARPNVLADSGDAINNCLLAFGVCYLPKGVYYRSTTIVIKAGDKLLGDGKGITTIFTLDGANTDSIVTFDFANLTGTQSLSLAVEPNLPIDFELRDFTVDGNYLELGWRDAGNTKNNTSGDGVKIYGRRYVVDLAIVNVPGVGFYSECLGAEGDNKVDDRKTSTVNLDILQCSQEGFVFRGPSDIRIESLFCGISGALPIGEQDVIAPTSTLYGTSLYSNYDKIDGCVFDVTPVLGESFNYSGSCETDLLHSFGNLNGIGVRYRGVNTQGGGGGRIKGQHLISESSLGGYVLEENIHYQISLMDSHNNKGNTLAVGGVVGTVPHIDIQTSQQSVISNIEVEKSGFETSGQTALNFSGANVMIGSFVLNANGNPGHGIFMDGRNHVITMHVYNCQGTAQDTTDSTGFIRNVPISTALNNVINGSVQGCDICFFSDGESDAEQIQLSLQCGSGQEMFTGDPPSSVKAQKWIITGEQDNVGRTNLIRAREDLDGSTTAAQTVVISLVPELVWTPELEDIFISLSDTFTVSNGVIDYVYINSLSRTSITIAYKFSTIISTAGPVRVHVHSVM